MTELDGVLIDTDVLVIGAGAGGLLAALSAKRHGPPGTRVTLCDSWLIGRTGHTAFSNAWTIVVLPDEIGRDALFRWVAIGAGATLLISLIAPLFAPKRPAPDAEARP